MTKIKFTNFSNLRALILGAPGSGKGTISDMIIKKYNVIHVSSGDILRYHVANKTTLGQSVNTYISQGKLVPDDVMNDLMKSKLGTLKEPWLLDGYPRTRTQAEKLSEFVDINLVINLVVPHNVIIDRLKSRLVHLPSGRIYNLGFNDPKNPGLDDITNEPLQQREDDKPEVVRKRLETYDATFKPVIEFYEEKNIVATFVGDQSKVIWKKLDEFLTKLKG